MLSNIPTFNKVLHNSTTFRQALCVLQPSIMFAFKEIQIPPHSSSVPGGSTPSNQALSKMDLTPRPRCVTRSTATTSPETLLTQSIPTPISPTSATRGRLEDTVVDFQLPEGFIGDTIVQTSQIFAQPRVPLTKEQIIALTLNEEAAKRGRGKVYWLKADRAAAGKGPTLLYVDHLWTTIEKRAFTYISHFQRWKECKGSVKYNLSTWDQENDTTNYGYTLSRQAYNGSLECESEPGLRLLTIRLIMLNGQNRLNWSAWEHSTAFVVHFNGQICLTLRRRWERYNRWDTMQGKPRSRNPHVNVTNWRAGERSVDMNGESARLLFGNDRQKSNAEILDQLEWLLETL